MQKLLVLLIGLLPFNKVRIFCYNFFLRYRIDDKSYIGWANYILINDCQIESSRIGNFNRIIVGKIVLNGAEIRRFNTFKYIEKFVLTSGCIIVSKNIFIGSNILTDPYKSLCTICIGQNSIITSGHVFDATDSIIIGDNVVFGGLGTQVWTHGFDLYGNRIQAPIVLGNFIYIGARSVICPGVRIVDEVSIGASTCVSKSIKESGFYVSHRLVRKSDVPSYDVHESVVSSVNNTKIYRK